PGAPLVIRENPAYSWACRRKRLRRRLPMANFNKNAVAVGLMLSQGTGKCETVMAPLRSANGRHRGRADVDLGAFCSGCLLVSLLAGATWLCGPERAAAAPPQEGLARPKPRLMLKVGEPIHTVAYSPDGKLLFAVGDRSIRVWNLATRTQ